MRPQIPEGASVRVAHLRTVTPYLPGMYPKHEIAEISLASGRIPVYPGPKGGRTFAEVTLPDGRSATGQADCSRNDTFSKRIGRDIAIGRALKALENGA